MIENRYLTSSETAKLLGFTPDYVRRLILTGKIKAVKCGHNWIVDPDDVKHIQRRRFPRQKD